MRLIDRPPQRHQPTVGPRWTLAKRADCERNCGRCSERPKVSPSKSITRRRLIANETDPPPLSWDPDWNWSCDCNWSSRLELASDRQPKIETQIRIESPMGESLVCDRSLSPPELRRDQKSLESLESLSFRVRSARPLIGVGGSCFCPARRRHSPDPVRFQRQSIALTHSHTSQVNWRQWTRSEAERPVWPRRQSVGSQWIWLLTIFASLRIRLLSFAPRHRSHFEANFSTVTLGFLIWSRICSRIGLCWLLCLMGFESDLRFD